MIGTGAIVEAASSACKKCDTNNRNSRGLCIQCDRDRHRRYREAHPDRIKERMDRFRVEHREQYNANYRRRYWADPEKARENNRKKYAQNIEAAREKSRRAMLKSNYGITYKEYDSILESQGGVCAVCKDKCPSGKRLSVDHNHATGEVRGLLCSRCNVGLGHMMESVDRCKSLIKYIETRITKVRAEVT